jgi:hypothetical protein
MSYDQSLRVKPDFHLEHALAEIRTKYGDTASVQAKLKTLRKFGSNFDVGTTAEEVWGYGGIETLALGNTIDTVSSSSASDTQDVVIEGHTISGSDLTFVVQTATLNGQNKVVLSTPLYRSTRIYNNNAVDFVGDVYVYEDDTIVAGVPQTPAKVHLNALGVTGYNQSSKCATSLSSTDYWIVTSIDVGVKRTNTRNVDFILEVKEFGGVFREQFLGNASNTGGGVQYLLDPTVIIPPNSDMRMIAISSGATTQVNAQVNGYLAKKLNV